MIILLLALAVGSLFASGTYLIMRRGQIKLILGLALLSHGVNLLIFGSGRLTEGRLLSSSTRRRTLKRWRGHCRLTLCPRP